MSLPFGGRMSQKFETIPGIQAASLSLDFDYHEKGLRRCVLAGRQAKALDTGGDAMGAFLYRRSRLSEKYWAIPRAGRSTPQTNEHPSPAIVIDDQFARRYFGDQDLSDVTSTLTF